MDWVFDGGRHCLDLVNTLRNRYAEGTEMLHVPADLARWLTAAGLPSGRVTPARLHATRELREAIDRVLLAVAGERRPRRSDVLLLNQTAGLAQPPTPQLAIGRDGPARRRRWCGCAPRPTAGCASWTPPPSGTGCGARWAAAGTGPR